MTISLKNARRLSLVKYLIELLNKQNIFHINIVRTRDQVKLESTCPFHVTDSDNHRAFNISITKRGNPWYCYSCHASGNLISLVALLEKRTYKEAADKLLQSNVRLPRITLEEVIDAISKMRDIESRIEPVELPMSASDDVSYDIVFNYLKKRNKYLDADKLIEYYELYYCGVGKYSDRIIFPIYDENFNTISFTNRAVGKARKKSLHPAGQKRESLLYGLHKFANYGAQYCIVVEGPGDVLAVQNALWARRLNAYAVVGLLGSTMTELQAVQLLKHYNNLILMLDNDEAGWEGAAKIFQDYKDYFTIFVGMEGIKSDPFACGPNRLYACLREAFVWVDCNKVDVLSNRLKEFEKC